MECLVSDWGTASIRAYGAQEAFRQESYKRIDKYTRAARTFFNLNRYVNQIQYTLASRLHSRSWVCIRIETLAGVFSAGLAAYLVYWGGVSASNTGFALTMAGKLCTVMQRRSSSYFGSRFQRNDPLVGKNPERVRSQRYGSSTTTKIGQMLTFPCRKQS